MILFFLVNGIISNKKKGRAKMKKNLAKIISVFMMLVLAMSLVACGSKSSSSGSSNTKLEELSAEELLKKVSDAAKDIRGVSATGNLGAKISVSGQEMEASAKFEVKSNSEPVQSYVKTDADINLMGQEQKMTVECYQIYGEDTVETYTNVLDKWTYDFVDLSEEDFDMEEIMEIFKDVDFSAVGEYFDKIEVKTSGNNYNLEVKLSSTGLIEKIENSIFSSVLDDVDTSVIPDTVINLTFVVDGKTFLPKSMSLGIDMESIESDGLEIELSDFVFDVKFNSFDSVEITVPDEALEAKENGIDSSAIKDLFE